MLVQHFAGVSFANEFQVVAGKAGKQPAPAMARCDSFRQENHSKLNGFLLHDSQGAFEFLNAARRAYLPTLEVMI